MELSSYALEPLPHDDEFTLYRGGQKQPSSDMVLKILSSV